jgi:hypothetical protein
MCTCYSLLHWRWLGYVSSSYCTTWHVSGSLLHVSDSYWTICRDPVVTHVNFLWAHVSCCGWITCHFFIGRCGVFLLVPFFIQPRVTALFVHVSHFYSATWLDDVLPRVGFLIAHVSCSGYFTCHALVPPYVAFLFNHMACSGSTAWSTINSS